MNTYKQTYGVDIFKDVYGTKTGHHLYKMMRQDLRSF
jgi:hypothetical protein